MRASGFIELLISIVEEKIENEDRHSCLHMSVNNSDRKQVFFWDHKHIRVGSASVAVYQM